MLPETITIEIDDKTKRVSTNDYVKAKTRQLQEFGYPTLNEAEVRSQLEKLIAGETLSVIGMFMQGEVVI